MYLHVSGQFREVLFLVNSHGDALERMEININEIHDILQQVLSALSNLQLQNAAETHVFVAVPLLLIP